MRVRLVAIVVVALLLSGSATAYAAWSRGAVVGAGAALRSGTFAATATWATAPDLTGVAPGAVRTGVLTVARAGHGRWVYTIGTPASVGGTVVVYPTAACTGAALSLPWSQTVVQAAAATPQHCVRYTASTPLASAEALGVTVPVTAESRPTN